MKLTKAEAKLLLPIGVTEFAGTREELIEDLGQTYWTIDDAPWPYWERAKAMKVLQGLATKLGFALDDADPVV